MPGILWGQDRSETKIIGLGLGLGLAGLVSCFKQGLVALVFITILKVTTNFQVLFVVFFLFCAWNITTVEINSGLHLLKS